MNKTDWYKKAVIYQIYPFSFKDNNNDGVGDIEGIVSKLDYLKELGINAIWFSPLYKSPDYDYGYDISDYKDIDPKFGSLNDFKKLIYECHNREIKVIMDMAINHSSIEHPWFKEAIKDKNSKYRNYYIIREGIKKNGKLLPPTNWNSTFTGSAWSNIKGTNDFYLHLFCVEQPDLNWENPEVRKEAAAIFNFWLEMGVDGFRLDVFNMFSKVYPLQNSKPKIAGTGEEYYVDGPKMHEYLRELNKEAFSKFDSYTVGESYKPHEKDALQYIDKNSHEIDTIFNFDHFSSDNIGGAKYFKKKFSLKQFKKGLFEPQQKYYQNGWNTLVLENHDGSRSVSRFGIDTNKYRVEASTFLATITFLGFGTPFIYMGEEFGMTNTNIKSIEDCKDPVSHFIYDMIVKFKLGKKFALNCIKYGARDHARVPMSWDDSVNGGFNAGAKPWMDLNSNYLSINAKTDLESDKSIFKYYQQIINYKKTNDILIYGSVKEYNHNSKQIIAYSRTYNNKTIFIFGNFSNKKAKYKLPNEFFKNDILISNFDEHLVKNNTYTLRPYEALVLEIK